MTRSFLRPHLAFSRVWRSQVPKNDGPSIVPHHQAECFREVMLPHMDAAYNFARYLARDPSGAEDIVQDAFLRAFRSFDSYRGESAKAWLFAIVRNCFYNWIAANRDRVSISSQASDEAQAIDEDTPEVILMRRNAADSVRAMIENLPEPFRETIVLRELEELSYKEIARLTAVPIGTVMSRLARARQMLAALLMSEDAQGRMIRP